MSAQTAANALAEARRHNKAGEATAAEKLLIEQADAKGKGKKDRWLPQVTRSNDTAAAVKWASFAKRGAAGSGVGDPEKGGLTGKQSRAAMARWITENANSPKSALVSAALDAAYPGAGEKPHLSAYTVKGVVVPDA